MLDRLILNQSRDQSVRTYGRKWHVVLTCRLLDEYMERWYQFRAGFFLPGQGYDYATVDGSLNPIWPPKRLILSVRFRWPFEFRREHPGFVLLIKSPVADVRLDRRGVEWLYG